VDKSKGFALIELIIISVALTIIAVIIYFYLSKIYKKPASEIRKPAIVVNIK
jgi:Tfp pilus assembly protein PilE